MKVLVINCGSSSLKYQLINPTTEEVFAIGMCERIGIAGSRFEYEIPATKFEIEDLETPMPTHKEALELVMNTLTGEHGVIASVEEIDSVGHRIVHGGEDFTKSVLVTEEVLEAIAKNNELAPLHNPANLLGVETIMALMPGKPNVVTFDTAFHQTMPAKAFMYALPYADYTELKVRKYGFHGTSHNFVSAAAIEMLGNPAESKIIVCHLGNGSSVSAVLNGKCIDTSMGLTPLQGLMMGTRCGDIDPAAVNFIKNKRGLTDAQMDSRLNKESGILGIYEKSSDFRDLSEARLEGDERATLGVDMLTYKIRSYVASYAAAMGGVDAICFTGGIGENATIVREKVTENLEFMGIKLNQEKNLVRVKGNVNLSADDSTVAIFKIPTNEELVIARDTYALTK